MLPTSISFRQLVDMCLFQAHEAEVESPSNSENEKTEIVSQGQKRALSFSFGKRALSFSHGNSRAFSISEGRKSDNSDSKSQSGSSGSVFDNLTPIIGHRE